MLTKIEANDVLSAGATTTATVWLLFVPLPSLPVVHSLIERRTRIFFKSELYQFAPNNHFKKRAQEECKNGEERARARGRGGGGTPGSDDD